METAWRTDGGIPQHRAAGNKSPGSPGAGQGLGVACLVQAWPSQRSATVSTSRTWLTVMYLDPTAVQCRVDEHDTAVRLKLRARSRYPARSPTAGTRSPG